MTLQLVGGPRDGQVLEIKGDLPEGAGPREWLWLSKTAREAGETRRHRYVRSQDDGKYYYAGRED